MIKHLENQIRDLQRELAEIKRDQVILRTQPCRGDSEIKGKDAKLDELDRRAKTITDSIRNTTRNRQLMISRGEAHKMNSGCGY